eukprot:5949148-Prorocentrum_lima.AAC.1
MGRLDVSSVNAIAFPIAEPLAHPAEGARVFEMLCYLCSTGWVLKPLPSRIERRNAIPPFMEDG